LKSLEEFRGRFNAMAFFGLMVVEAVVSIPRTTTEGSLGFNR